MTKGQRQVREFMQFFGQPTPKNPIQFDEATAKLRAKLILEEAFETITKGLGLRVWVKGPEGSQVFIDEETLSRVDVSFTKLKAVDLVQLADGLADLAYVGEFGTAVAAGIDLEPIQEEVHRSNMSKRWTQQDLDAGKTLYPSAKVEDYGGGLYRLIREDGKVIKSPSYQEANLSPLIQAQIFGELAQIDKIQLPETVTCPNCGDNAFSLEFSYCNECGAQSYEEPK